jgi:hypothetical protein
LRSRLVADDVEDFETGWVEAPGNPGVLGSGVAVPVAAGVDAVLDGVGELIEGVGVAVGAASSLPPHPASMPANWAPASARTNDLPGVRKGFISSRYADGARLELPLMGSRDEVPQSRRGP